MTSDPCEIASYPNYIFLVTSELDNVVAHVAALLAHTWRLFTFLYNSLHTDFSLSNDIIVGKYKGKERKGEYLFTTMWSPWSAGVVRFTITITITITIIITMTCCTSISLCLLVKKIFKHFGTYPKPRLDAIRGSANFS